MLTLSLSYIELILLYKADFSLLSSKRAIEIIRSVREKRRIYATVTCWCHTVVGQVKIEVLRKLLLVVAVVIQDSKSESKRAALSLSSSLCQILQLPSYLEVLSGKGEKKTLQKRVKKTTIAELEKERKIVYIAHTDTKISARLIIKSAIDSWRERERSSWTFLHLL